MSLSYHRLRFRLLISTLLVACAVSAPSNRDAEVMKNYFIKYTTDFFATAVQPSALGSDASALLDLSLEDNPIFRDHITTFQDMADLETTGEINTETLERMEDARCGVPDTIFDPNAPGKYEVQSKWLSKRDSTTGYYVVTYSFPRKTTPKDLKFNSFKKGVTLAMCSWELISNFRFKNIGLGKKSADVVISYEKGNHGDGYSFDGLGGTLGHAFYPEDGRLHLDMQEKWYLAKPDKEDHTKKDVYSVALHELGHTIGLLHSKEYSAIMAPFYRFRGTFENLEMPKDEVDGVTQMYGKRKDSNPAEEEFSACKEAKLKYGYVIEPPAMEKENKTTAVLEEFEVPACEDDPRHATLHCPAWKARGFCTEKIFVRTLHKRCPKTCGFCSGAVPTNKKPEKVVTPSGLANTICDIRKFDSVMTTYDDRDGFAAVLFKDDYFFKTEIALSSAKFETLSLFDTSEDLKGAYKWDTDPKTILPGLFMIKSPNFMEETDKSHASVIVGKRYFVFDDERVHIYRSELGILSHNLTRDTQEIFPGYPNLKVDAAHASVNEQEDSVTYTLFYRSKIWQYKGHRDRGHRDNLLFGPLTDKIGVDISEWNGVPACNIDAVFEYRGIPYFLKGNIFWPAVDTEPQIPRDITYNFFRCWNQEPVNLTIPSSCDAGDLSDDSGNHATSSAGFGSTLLLSAITLINHMIFKSIL